MAFERLVLAQAQRRLCPELMAAEVHDLWIYEAEAQMVLESHLPSSPLVCLVVSGAQRLERHLVQAEANGHRPLDIDTDHIRHLQGSLSKSAQGVAVYPSIVLS